MKVYHDLLNDILAHGEHRDDRTGVGTISVFARQLRFDLRKEFPAITTKKLAWKSVVSELLWFLEGSNDERRLCEILHGSRDAKHKTIWTANAQADYWKSKAAFDGDLGRVYGVNWRRWRKYTPVREEGSELGDIRYQVTEIDQVKNLIEGIKHDPHGRRHILTAWNVGEMDQMALPPCHCFAQFYVSGGKLSCQMYQRSVDLPLGAPFNIASYSLLTHMIAQVCGLEVGDFVHTMGDVHIYSNQIEGVKEQLTRTPLPSPQLWLNPEIKNIDDFRMEDIKLLGYQHHGPIDFPFAV